MLSRVIRAWRALASEQRLAAIASLLLFATMFLPWYQQNVVVSGTRTPGQASENLSAFGVFSFVEAAVLLVAVAVLVLLWSRAEGKAFHLPGGDGTIVTIAGGWVALLLIWRLFDKPDLQGDGVGNMGIQWGIFFALCAAGLLTLAGTRMRAAHRPEPPNPEADASDPQADAARAAERERRAAERERRAAERRRRGPARTQPTRPLSDEAVATTPLRDETVATKPLRGGSSSAREPFLDRADLPADGAWEIPEPPTRRMRAPDRAPEPTRERERGEPQTERLFDEG